MNCHKITASNLIVLWGQKCGATHLKEILMHIESGSYYNNRGNDHVTHSIYHRYYKSPLEDNLDQYTNDEVLLFGRNPYYRILSLYVDKYVMTNSPTPDIGDCIQTFNEFIRGLANTGFDSKESHRSIFSGFFPLTKSQYFNFYSSHCHIKPILLDENIIPDAKLTHNVDAIKLLYDLSGRSDKYSEVQRLFEKQWSEKQNKKTEKCDLYTNLEHAPLNELREILKTHRLNCESFFSPTLKEQFELLYQEEFILYSKWGIKFGLK